MIDAIQFVHRFEHPVLSANDDRYVAMVYASERNDRHWDGWLVFLPALGGHALPTDRETTQPSLQAVSYWASGLTPVYLEGALQRAIDLTPEATLHRRAMAMAREEAIARAEADAYERAARQAREVADAAAKQKDEAKHLRDQLAKDARR